MSTVTLLKLRPNEENIKRTYLYKRLVKHIIHENTRKIRNRHDTFFDLLLNNKTAKPAIILLLH